MPTLITQFSSRIAPDVPGAPAARVRQALIDAATEFCTRTHAWNEIQDAILVSANNADYELELPSHAIPLTVEEVWAGSDRLTPLTMTQLHLVLPDWQSATGTPAYYNAEVDMLGFRVFPAPAASGLKLRIRGSFAPTEASESLPDFMWTKYRETLASGAKARLLVATESVAWSNPKLGAYHQTLFDSGIADARIAVLHGRVAGVLTVTPRRFG